MSVFAFLNQKGGAGKTTNALALAASLARIGEPPLVIDADPQHSALNWAAARAGDPLFVTVGNATPTIHKDINTHKEHYPHIIIDGPPSVVGTSNEINRSAILACDVLVIPVQPSAFDIWAASQIVALYKEAVLFKPNLKAVFLLNRKIANTAIGRDMTKALDAYPEVMVLDTTIGQRVVFAEVAGMGQSVFELGENSDAAREIEALRKELLEIAK